MKKLQLVLLACFTIWLFFSANAVVSNNGFVWRNIPDTSLNFSLSANICPSSAGVQTLTATVHGFPSGSLESNADVNARAQYPDNTTADINFSNAGSGTYTNDFNFNHDINASKTGVTTASRTYYIYVQSFGINSIFLNNNPLLTAGSTGTIRNQVTNDDGNAFVDINGLTTIYYPNGSTFVNNGVMTDLGTGEYIYAFTVPSTGGTYTVTSSFTCGSETDSNSAGRFIVPSAGGGTGGGTETGGGGGGSGGSAGRLISGKTLDIQVDELEIGKPSKIKVSVLNSSTEKTSFYVEVKINQGTLEEYKSFQLFSQIPKNETKEMEFLETFTPLVAGSHVVTARLLSINQKTEYDKLSKVFDIVGEVRYDVALTCLTRHALPGTQADAQIALKNLGNYYEDVFLSWWVENEQGEIIGLNELPLALFSGEEKILLQSVALPSAIPVGNYSFKAKIQYRDEARIGSCNFVVEREPEYYARIISELNESIKQAEEKIKSLAEQGFDMSVPQQKIGEIEGIMSRIQKYFDENNFVAVNENIQIIQPKIKELLSSLDTFVVETAAFVFFPSELFAVLAAITLIFGIGALLLGDYSAEELLGFGKGKGSGPLGGALGLRD